MGAPVTGSGVRAMVATGGGLTMRGLVPGLHSRRLQMIFPLAGPARRGLVSIEAKKRKVGKRITSCAPSPCCHCLWSCGGRSHACQLLCVRGSGIAA